MSDQILRSNLIRLASEKPYLRAHLLPLLRQAGVRKTLDLNVLEDFAEFGSISLLRKDWNRDTYVKVGQNADPQKIWDILIRKYPRVSHFQYEPETGDVFADYKKTDYRIDAR